MSEERDRAGPLRRAGTSGPAPHRPKPPTGAESAQ